MDLTGERLLNVSRVQVWDALNDPEVLKACVPGCESITATGDNGFDIVMNAAVGPVKARFKGAMTITDADAPNGYALAFEGSGGAAGFARGSAQVRLSEPAPGQTLLTYTSSAKVGGKLAQIGSRLVEAASGAMADKFFAAFSAHPRLQPAVSADAPAAGVADPGAAKAGAFATLKAFLMRLFGRTAVQR